MTTPAADSAMTEFLSECDEIIQRVSISFQTIEKEKGKSSAELIDAVYRDVHTLKGSSQLFGFSKIGKLAHAMEASLAPIRRLKRPIESELIDALFRSLDLIERMIKALHTNGKEEGFDDELSQILPKLIESASQQFGGEFTSLKDTGGVIESKPTSLKLASTKPKTSEPMSQSIKETEPAVAPVKEPEQQEQSNNVSPPAQATQAQASAPAAVVDTTIRVQVGLLDRLMNLVGELVLVRNQVLQFLNKSDNLEFLNLSQNLDVVTSELQSEVMKTRMQPIGNILSKFQRVIRDLAKDLGKKIDLTLQGTETELDKTLLEAIKDPLTHIIRNSCDHGIETIEERKKAGKPETGHVLIRSFHEGGQVIVEVSDDGKGLDRTRLVEKAIEKSLLTREKANQLQDWEILNLIFLPGFSTAKQVSSVSGRGVGMDVVRTNIERIGGTVELTSQHGKGTTIRLKIPLTLAIVPALIVRAGSEKFAIPQIKLVQLVRVDSSEGGDKIEFLQDRPVFRLRNELLPLLSLDVALGTQSIKKEEYRKSLETANIVVLNAEGVFFGLIVDEILDTADIVVKPLNQVLKSLSVFSGATIMGDGSCALILDVTGLAAIANIDAKSHRRDDSFLDITGRAETVVLQDAQEFLLFRVNSESTHAIPLCLVHRLEEFNRNDIEISGKQEVVQYRNSILPLISLEKCLNYQDENPQKIEKVPTIVIQRQGRSYGIKVGEILDVVTINDSIDDAVRDRAGILGNIIHEKEVIVVVDALGIVEHEVTRMKSSGAVTISAKDSREAIDEIKALSRDQKQRKVRVLFAEDVPFFRKHVKKVLEAAGHEIFLVEDGKKALEKLRSSKESEFNLILSDIEMPNMNGYELAREIRKEERFKNIPLIALTTRFSQKDIQEGKNAGFNLYLEKLNPEKLLNGINEVIASQFKES